MRIITKNYQKNEGFIFQETTSQDVQYKDPWVEFMICLLPSYIFLLISLFRCLIIKSYRIFTNQSHIPYLKTLQVIAYIMSLSYIASFCVAFWRKDLLKINPMDEWMIFLYLPASLAWYLSYKLTVYELQRKLTSAKCNQLLLYIATLSVYIYKLIITNKKSDIMASETMDFLGAGMDILRILLSFLAIIVFSQFEKRTRENFKASEINSSLSEELLKGYQLQPMRRTHSQPSLIGRGIKKGDLPKINVEIERKFQREFAPNINENCFIIKVSIENNKLYKITKTLSQIIELERELRSYYTLSRFPVLSTMLPILDHTYLERSLRENKLKDKELIRIIQSYLTDLTNMPEFLHEIAVDFLEIPDHIRDDYILFVDGLKSTKTSSAKSYTRFSTMYKNIMINQEAAVALDLLRLTKMELEVKKIKYDQSEIKGDIVYVFEVKRWEEGELKLTWIIGKSYNDFLLFNQKMESQVSSPSLPNVLNYVPEVPETEGEDCCYNAEYWERTLDKFESYLKSLLTCKKAKCTTLLDFLGLDPLTYQRNSFSSEEDFLLHEQL